MPEIRDADGLEIAGVLFASALLSAAEKKFVLVSLTETVLMLVKTWGVLVLVIVSVVAVFV